MNIRNLNSILLVCCLFAGGLPVTTAIAQTAASPNRPAPVDTLPTTFRSGSLAQRETDVEDRLNKYFVSGVLRRASFDSAKDELNNIRVQEAELAARDQGLNPTDQDFISNRITALENRLTATTKASMTSMNNLEKSHPSFATLAETPGALTCNGKRVLLSVGRDHATASVQRYGDANFAFIVEAVASPYDRGDDITLRVTGPGLSAKVDGTSAGQYLVASTTTNFSLKSKHLATIVANVASNGSAMPQYVKIWGSCAED